MLHIRFWSSALKATLFISFLFFLLFWCVNSFFSGQISNWLFSGGLDCISYNRGEKKTLCKLTNLTYISYSTIKLNFGIWWSEHYASPYTRMQKSKIKHFWTLYHMRIFVLISLKFSHDSMKRINALYVTSTLLSRKDLSQKLSCIV